MNEDDKHSLKRFIQDRAPTPAEKAKVLFFLVKEFAEEIDNSLPTLAMALVQANYTSLKKDFLLLRKNASENMTLTETYDKKELDKTKDCGAGFYKDRTIRNIIIAGSRFGLDKFPEHMPQTEKVLEQYKISMNDMTKAKEEASTLIKLENGDKYY